MSGTNKIENINSSNAFIGIGGIIGGGSGANLTNIKVSGTNIVMNGDNSQGAGMIVGGLEGGNIINSDANGGSIVAIDSGAYSVGGLTGCMHEGQILKNSSVKNVEVKVGKNASLIAGLSGHSGTSQGEPTLIENCKAQDVKIIAGEGSQRIGMIGYYMQKTKQYYAEPTNFIIKNSSASGSIDGGDMVGTIAGLVWKNSKVENSTSSVKINGVLSNKQIGGDSTSVLISQLK